MENILLEIVIRKTNDKDFASKIPESLQSYMVFETAEKIVFDVPNNWSGFRDGTIIALLREFGEAMYAALAYFSQDNDEFVTDFEGKFFDMFDVVIGGKRFKKFVKKRIQIVKIFDKEKDQFEVKRYLLDLKSTNPIISVLDMYSIGADGGLKSNDFIGS